MNHSIKKTGIGKAPGKIILFGEHAVVYDKPAIAIPVKGLETKVQIEQNDSDDINIHANDIQLNSSIQKLQKLNPLRHAIELTLEKLSIESSSFDIFIESDIPVASGLGSGAAVSVAIVKALLNFFNKTISLEEINQIAYEVEKIHHGTPSGIDNTTITYQTPIFYQKTKPIEFLSIKGSYHFIIANSGIQASTKDVVLGVRQRFEKDQAIYHRLFDQIGTICNEAKIALSKGNITTIANLMNQNQIHLADMGVSSPKLDELIMTARNAGAFGAKLSGAGVGGNIICLIEEEHIPSVQKALKNAGAAHVFTTTLEG